MRRIARRPGAFARIVAPCLALAIGLWIPAASAQDQDDGTVPTALQPLDNSSPRDTLGGFLANMDVLIDAWRRNDLDEDAARARRRAVNALDLSSTPHGDTALVRTRSVLLLYEVLSRLPLPSPDDIPGDDEVTETGITEWRIPGTTIAIQRIESGPRQGAFLFDAQTVERLERLYRHVADLPYQEGRAPGAYLEFIESDETPSALGREVRNRLKPVDTSHPRATLEGFMDSVNRANDLIRTADAALRESPPGITVEEAEVVEREALNLLRRAASALDLSEVPAALQEDVGLESALQLKEILDRIPLPPYDTVPGPRRVAAAREAGTPLHWRIPNTRLDIVEVSEGELQGEFLFSAATVARLDDHYNDIADLPYRRGLERFRETQDEAYLSAGISEGFYEFYISTPGFLLPQATPLGRLIDAMPASLKTKYGGQTIWQWTGLIVCVLLAIMTAMIVIPSVTRFSRRLDAPKDDWAPLLAPAAIAAVVFVLTKFVIDDINITGAPQAVVGALGTGTVYLMGAWAIYILCKAVGELIIRSPKILEESLDASLLRIAARVIGFLAGAWFAIDRLSHLGLDLIPLLAGLGVGGLAVALAAQRTLANFIGGLILYANKPVRVGDFCRFGTEMGTVEEIGLQTTRIRTLERSIITIPNGQFSEMQVNNLATRDRRLFRTTLQLRYETTPDQMRFVLAKLRALLLAHPKVSPDPARVRFKSFGAYSKDVEIFSYLHCQDQNTFLAMQEDLLLRIDDIIEEAGTGFAFPSQTAYLSRDSGLDAERAEQAGQQVESWRQQKKLPFPEFADEERKQLEDQLAYPPEGSPDHGREPGGQATIGDGQLSEASRLRRWIGLG